MKKCTVCKQDKNLEEFNKNNSRSDGLNNICKICSRERSKKYYSDNKDHHKSITRIRTEIIKEDNKLYILELLSRSECADCGNKDIRVMEFDHVRGIKYKDISMLLGGAYSLETLKMEIGKCDIVCANCHRIRTGERSPNYRTEYLKENKC